nr:transcription antitermination factor NusB [Bacteroidota bacterium]
MRIKALQALYSFFRSNTPELSIGEKNMLKSTEKIYELIMHQLSFLVEIVKFAEYRIEEGKKKFYPTSEDLNPSTKFINNRLVKIMTSNRGYIKRMNAYRINWVDEIEAVRKIYNLIRKSDDYQKFANSGKDSFDEDKKFLISIFKDYVAYAEYLESFYEEKDIYWADDIDTANVLVIKVLKGFRRDQDEFEPLPSLYNESGKDEVDEDKRFLKELYRKTILKSSEFEKMIETKASNWELDRIAVMDIILLKMALAELLEFPSIPVKVTMNEYIDLSKYYSTPKSKVFINGILDKMIADLREEKRIVKIGRGLIE